MWVLGFAPASASVLVTSALISVAAIRASVLLVRCIGLALLLVMWVARFESGGGEDSIASPPSLLDGRRPVLAVAVVRNRNVG
jgi:hypothetical protein